MRFRYVRVEHGAEGEEAGKLYALARFVAATL